MFALSDTLLFFHKVLRTFTIPYGKSSALILETPNHWFDAMKRKDIRDLISGALMPFGRGFKYECRINGDYVDGTNELKSKVEEGDEVRIDVIRGHQKRWSDGRFYDRVRLTIEDSQENRDTIERYRNLNTRSSVLTKRNNDYQKSKLYNWERRFVPDFRGNHIEDKTENGAEEFLNPIFKRLELETPTVKYHGGRDTTCSYFGYKNEIRIGDWGYSKAVLIHEASHAIVDQLGLGPFVSWHGPLFVSVYVEILTRKLNVNKKELIKGLDAYGIDYIENFSLERWLRYYENDNEIGVPEINRIRCENYVLKDGTELNKSQKETLKKLNGNGKNKVDGRSVRALINRDLARKNGEGYELTEKGEDALENIRNEIV